MKNKKAVVGIIASVIIGLIVIGGIGTGIYFVSKSQAPQVLVQPSSGAQFIPNPHDPASQYTKIVDGNRFTCDVDECIVSGSMEVNKALKERRVVFRTNTDFSSEETSCRFYKDKWIAIDIDGDGFLEKYEQLGCTTTSSCPSFEIIHKVNGDILTLPNGDFLKFRKTRNLVYICNGDGAGYSTFEDSASSEIDVTPTPKEPYTSNNQEVSGEDANIFLATFNFCPSGVPSFPFCSGNKNIVESNNPQTYFTDEFKLLIGQSITFEPKNDDRSEIIKRTIRVKKYDLSCIPAIEQGTACESGKIKCVGKECTKCLNPKYGGTPPNCWYGCAEYSTNKYLKCDATQQIGQSICGAFGTTEFLAPLGQECFLLDSDGKITNQHGKGIGGLACPGDPCALGEKKGITGTQDYEECILVGTCNKFSSKFCPEGLVYNDIFKDCIFPEEDSCNPQEAQCTGLNTIRKCERVTIGEKVGYQWAKTIESCPGELGCKDNEGDFDTCSCEELNVCSLGDIQCIDNKRYRECSKDPNNVNSCFVFRDLGSIVGDLKECINNEIKLKPGCQSGETICTNEQDCINNVCVCKTSGDFCNAGDSSKCVGDNLKSCQKIGECYKWVITTPPKDKRCSNGEFTCINTGDFCNAGDSDKCVDINNIKSCQKIGECYKWVTNKVPSDKNCVNNQLVCKTTGEFCNAGDSNLCKGDFNFRECIQVGECYKWRDNSCPSQTKCSQGTCIGFGCEFGTPGFECDINNFETCINNQCVCIQDEDSATQSDFANFNSRCKENIIQKVSKIGNCYRWEVDSSASNSINGLCEKDFFCLEQNKKAKCEPGFEFVGITTEENYGVNQQISNIKIIATNKIPGGNVNLDVVARLLDGTTILKQVNTITDSNGEVLINFNYTHPRVGDLRIEVSVDPTGQNFQQTKIIQIEKTLEVKLTCPPQGFKDREITCDWKMEDADTGNPISATPKIKIIQGMNELSYTPIGTSSVKFMSSTLGSVSVEVGAEKEGFISDTAIASVQIQSTISTQTFNIDNKDFFTYEGLGVSTGIHQLELVIEESGQEVEVQSIGTTITTPTGQEVPLTFNKVAEGRFKTTYNFQQSGTTYFLSGTAYFLDLSKDPLLFEYPIVTLGGTTEKEKTNINLLLIGGGVAVFVILAIILFLIFRRKR